MSTIFRPTFDRARRVCVLMGLHFFALTFAWADNTPPAAPSNVNVAITVPSFATQNYLAAHGANPGYYNQKDTNNVVIANTVPGYARMMYVTWQNNAADADFLELSFRVDDSASGHTNFGGWAVITYLNVSTTSYSWDYPLYNATGTPVQFRVIACKGSVDTQGHVTVNVRSNPADGSTPYVATPSSSSLVKPDSLTAAVVSGTDGLLHFTWHDPNDNEEGYQLFVREHNDTTPNAWPTDPSTTLSFGSSTNAVVSTLVAGKSYDMRIRAERATSYQTSSPYAATVTDTTDYSNVVTVAMPALSPPSGLTATKVTETTLHLAWTINSSVADTYEIQYGTDPTQPFSTYPLNGPLGRTQAVDLFWFPNSLAYWQVVAVQNTKAANGTVTSTQRSAPTSAVPLTLDFFPATNLTVNLTHDSQTSHVIANLSWVDHSLIETGYAVMVRQTGSSGSYSPIFTVATANATSATVDIDSLPSPSTGYDFVVEAYYDYTSGGGVSEFASNPSNVVPIKFDSITSPDFAHITYKQAFTAYTLTATAVNSTLQSRTVTGLPAGIIFDNTTATVKEATAGAGPQESGLFICPMTVTYANGWVAKKNLALRVVRPPSAPITPVTIANRTIPVATTTIPLSEMFADPDTEDAVRLDTTLGTLDIVLQKTLTPATYANFMAYANNHDYDGTVFHRLSPGFVIQGGGYKPVPLSATITTPDHFKEVTQRPSPTNEPGIPNLRGTIALAKGSTPSSGTHDFFINLVDGNTDILDTNTGGFTVFGRVTHVTANPAAVSSPSDVSAVQVSPTVDAIQNLWGQGSGSYTINLTSSGQTTESTGVNVFGSANLGSGTIWPLTAPSSTMDNTKCVVMNTVSPITQLITYTYTNSNPENVAVDTVNGNLVLTGKVDTGTSSIGVTATDLDGNTTTQSFTVTVSSSYQAAQIGTQPINVNGKLGQAADIIVAANGSDLHFQWRKAGVPIDGTANPSALTSTLHFATLAATDAGDYQVLVSNSANVVLSSVAHLTVYAPAHVTSQPADTTVNYYAAATFGVTATSDTSISYQWYRNNTPSTDTFQPIAGATNSSYTIQHALLTDTSTTYRVVVTNSGGDVTSSSAKLVVNTIDTDHDGLTDDQELTFGTSPTNADTDGDGYSDSVELSLGTDPRRADSSPASTYFVASNNGTSALAALTLKSIPASAAFRSPLQNFAGVPVPQQWMAATETTNEQFATLLHLALNKMNVIEIVASGGRRFVRYPKTTGNIVCYLAPLPGDPPATGPVNPPSCEVGADAEGTTFFVAKAVAKMPVRAVSWYGAYLASAAINDYYGYTAKCTANWTYAPATPGIDQPTGTATANGFSIPTYTAWDWAATSAKLPESVFPSGATVLSTQASFGNTSSGAGPKAVASYLPTSLGLYDMAGNVAEWVQDQTTIPSTTSYVRGGSFASPVTELKITSNQAVTRDTISDKVGFRLTLAETPGPHDITGLADKFVKVGDTVTLSVSAKGAPPLTYQWLKDKKPLTGITGASLRITNAQLTDAGKYSVTITTNGAGTRTSDEVNVSIVSLVTPQVIGSPGKPASFSVKVASPPGNTFIYEWRQVVGSTISPSSGTAAVFTIPLVTSSYNGIYRCKITPPSGKGLNPITLDSELIVLKVPATIAGLPANVNLPAGVVGGYYSLNPMNQLFDGSTDRTPTSYVITGLQSLGLSYNPKTGLIYGRLTKESPNGIATLVNIVATNSEGSASVNSINLIIKPIAPAAIGTFVASIGPEATLNSNLGGRLDFTCTPTGAYSGTVTLGGTSYKIVDFLGGSVTNGTVDGVVSSTVVIPRTGKSSLYVSFAVDVANASHLLSGTFGDVAIGSSTVTHPTTIAGWRKLDYAGATAAQLGRYGYHTMALDAPASVTDATLAPKGGTFLTANVLNTGDVNQAGRLADGTVLAGSCPMSTNGNVLVFSSLYTAKGSMRGSYTIASGHAMSLGTDGIVWYKLATTDQNYKAGFGPLSLAFGAGGLYSPPVGVAVMGLVDQGTFTADAKVTFTGGSLVSPNSISLPFEVSNLNTCNFTIPPTPNPNSITGKVDKNTGVFTGTFVMPGTPSRTATWFGVITPQKTAPTKMAAYGAFTLPQTTGGPILSGSTVVTPYP